MAESLDEITKDMVVAWLSHNPPVLVGVPPAGLEPATYDLEGRCSAPMELRVRWPIWEDSNLRPHAYQTRATAGNLL
jgi:hypothetical protein